MFFCSHNCTGGNPLSTKFPCRLCSVELTNQQMLKKHFTLYHPENLQFQCRTCHVEFDSLSEIVDHMGTHLKTTSQCSLCLQTFSKKDLNNHYETVHPGMDRSVCLICNKKYSDPASLAKHTMVHTGERPYYCPFCYMSFGLKCSQVVHIRRHMNYRPYKCQHCPKSFFNAGEVRKHERLHTGEKPYNCTICKMSFTMRETLTNHLKTHKKYNMKCHHCPMGFNDPKMLETHMSTHSGVKPFQCPLCLEAKFHLGSLRRHIISLHTDNLNTNCQICGQFEEDTFSLAQHILTHRTDYVSSRAQWVEIVENANKSHLSSKKKTNTSKLKKRTFKETNKRPRRDSDTISYNVVEESHPVKMVEEPNQSYGNIATCNSNANGEETIFGSQNSNQKKKRVRQKNSKFIRITSSKKNKKDQFNHAIHNSAEEYEEKFEIPQTFSSNTSECEYSYEHDDIKTEIKDEEEDADDNYDEQIIGGIQEVEVPEFQFQPLRKEFECSLCQECFMSQEELLQHVGVHI